MLPENPTGVSFPWIVVSCDCQCCDLSLPWLVYAVIGLCHDLSVPWPVCAVTGLEIARGPRFRTDNLHGGGWVP